MAIIFTSPKFESITSKWPFTRQNREYCLIHGNSFQIVNRNFQTIDGISSLPGRKGTRNFIVLLGSPYINTYVHETIPLSKRDLPAVDQQILPFSRSLPECIRIDSIAINQHKAITIHSHVTDRGIRFLDQFKKIGGWQPAIAYFIKKLIAEAAQIPTIAKTHVIIFENEVLRISRTENNLQISHFSLWPDHLPQHRAGIVKALVEADQKHTPFSYLNVANIGTETNISEDSTMQELLAATSFQKVKSISCVRQKNRLRYFRKKLRYFQRISLQYVLVSTLVCTIGFAVISYNRLSRLKNRQHSLSSLMETLASNTAQIEPIIRKEREYYRLSSLMEAITQSRFNPSQILVRISSVLPKTTWINSVFINDREITIDLFDTEAVDISQLLERFSAHLGRPNLVLNEDVVIEDRKVKHYKFTLSEWADGSIGKSAE